MILHLFLKWPEIKAITSTHNQTVSHNIRDFNLVDTPQDILLT